MRATAIVSRLLEDFPDFERSGSKVTSPHGKLKDMTVEQVDANIVLFHMKEGNFMKSPGWTMLYFMDTEQAAKDMQAGKVDYPMFVPGSLSARCGGYSMIDALWKKPSARLYKTPEDKARRDARSHVVGALEAYVTPQGIYADNISVRPGWRRNSIATKLMQALQNRWPDLPIEHSKETQAGGKFLKATGYYKPAKEAEES